jgi:hypothetical protein
VDGSHHDLTAFEPGATEVCLYCHGVLDTNIPTGDYGEVGGLCLVRCHDGAGFVSDQRVIPNRAATIAEDGTPVGLVATVDAVNVTPGYAHGLTKANLLNPATGVGVVSFSGVGAAFPYGTAPASGGPARIECTSCHNVHDNTNTPFLQTNLFTGGPAGESFCEACHTARGNSWVAGEQPPNGEHPVNFGLVLGDVTTRTHAQRRGRYINLDGGIFDVATSNGTDLNGVTNQYTVGGKVGGFGAAANGTTFGCYTCHGVHVDLNGTVQQTNLLLRDVTSADGSWNPICVGCHGQQATGLDDANPGLSTSAYYHPAGSTANATTGITGTIYSYVASTGAFSFDVDLGAILDTGIVGGIAENMVGIEQGAGNGKPRCGSCHDVHGGINNSQVLVDLDGTRDGLFTGKVCDACHTGVGLLDVADNAAGGEPANSHHRTRTGDWSTATVTDADTDTLILDGTNSASWLSAADHTNGLDCADCHVFLKADGSQTIHSTAHNW